GVGQRARDHGGDARAVRRTVGRHRVLGRVTRPRPVRPRGAPSGADRGSLTDRSRRPPAPRTFLLIMKLDALSTACRAANFMINQKGGPATVTPLGCA